MRELTLIMAYYDNPVMLAIQADWLAALRPEVRAATHWIVVDDGSPEFPAQTCFKQVDGLASQRLFRMKVDVPWNQDACRNLAVSQATTRWLLLTDMDHLIPEETFMELMTQRWLEQVVYQFERVTLSSLQPFVTREYKHHPNTWYMTRAVYEQVGGYDERFAGYYGTDGDFRSRVQSVAAIKRLRSTIIRVPREVVTDASTTRLTRRSDNNTAALKRLQEERAAAAPWRPLNGLFPWEQIA